MKTAVLTFAAVAAQLVAAQSRADYFPSCALDCLAKGTTDATNCAADDAWCWCIQANYEAIYDSSQLCVLNDCGAIVALSKLHSLGVLVIIFWRCLVWFAYTNLGSPLPMVDHVRGTRNTLDTLRVSYAIRYLIRSILMSFRHRSPRRHPLLL